MCLSIPGKIKEVYEDGSLTMGRVDFGGVLKEVCLDYVPEAQVGQFVLIHVGFAISVLNDEEAIARLDVTRQNENFEENLM
jgi:hydrogenase expression/formation protein HypC